VISLGIPSDRDICQECHATTARQAERRQKHAATQIATSLDPADWLAHTDALIADEYLFLAMRAAEGAPLSTLINIRRNIGSRERLAAQVRAALPPTRRCHWDPRRQLRT
jgi:hypothetical protein